MHTTQMIYMILFRLQTTHTIYVVANPQKVKVDLILLKDVDLNFRIVLTKLKPYSGFEDNI